MSLSLLLGLGAPVKTAGCQLGGRKALLCVCICRRVDRCLAGERRTGSGQTGRKPSSPSFDEFCLGAVSGVFGSTPTGRIYCSTHHCPVRVPHLLAATASSPMWEYHIFFQTISETHNKTYETYMRRGWISRQLGGVA